MHVCVHPADDALASAPWGQIYKIIALAGWMLVRVRVVCDSPQLNATDIADIVAIVARRGVRCIMYLREDACDGRHHRHVFEYHVKWLSGC